MNFHQLEQIENEAGVYCIMHLPTGKFYIGSSINLLERMKGHNRDLKNGSMNPGDEKSRHSNKHLQNSFNKYNGENYVFFILEHVDNFFMVEEREQFWLDLYVSTKECFNVKKKATQISGYTHSQQSVENLRKISQENFGRKILQFNLEGNFIKEHTSIRGAAREIKISKQNITVCLKKSSLEGKGFHWVYKDELENKTIEEYGKEFIDKYQKMVNNRKQRMTENIKVRHSKIKRSIYKIDYHENKIIEKYNSVGEAGSKNKFKTSHISACLTYNKKSYKGFRWAVKEEYDNGIWAQKLEEKKNKPKTRKPQSQESRKRRSLKAKGKKIHANTLARLNDKDKNPFAKSGAEHPKTGKFTSLKPKEVIEICLTDKSIFHLDLLNINKIDPKRILICYDKLDNTIRFFESFSHVKRHYNLSNITSIKKSFHKKVYVYKNTKCVFSREEFINNGYNIDKTLSQFTELC